MHPDDLKNPEYRKGRYKPVEAHSREPVRRPAITDEARRARFAAQAARAQFGRFYWSDELAERMRRELAKSRDIKRAAKEAHRRKRNGAER